MKQPGVDPWSSKTDASFPPKGQLTHGFQPCVVAAKTWTSKATAKTGLVIKLSMEQGARSVVSHQEKTVAIKLVHHNSHTGLFAFSTGLVWER